MSGGIGSFNKFRFPSGSAYALLQLSDAFTEGIGWTPYSFPAADGTANYVLGTDGAGALSFLAHDSIAGGNHTEYLLVDGTRALGGDWDLGAFNLSNCAGLAFDDGAALVGGIQNQNLVDKSVVETIAGVWTFTADPVLSSATPSITFTDTDSGHADWVVEVEADDFTIKPSASPSEGDIVLDGPVKLQPNYADRAFATDQLSLLRFDATYTHDAAVVAAQNLVDLNPTVTQDVAVAWTFAGMNGRGTFTSTAATAIATYMLFIGQPQMKSATTSVPPVTPTIFWAAPTCEATANNVGSMGGSLRSLYGHPTVKTSTAASAQMTVPTVRNIELQGRAQAAIAGSSLTVTDWSQLYISSPSLTTTGTLTFTNLYGIYLEDLTAGTNNYGIESGISAGANKWFLHHSGTAKSLLGGDLQINGSIGFYGTAPAAQPGSYTFGTWATDRALSSSPSNTELRNVLATLINDLMGLGLVG